MSPKCLLSFPKAPKSVSWYEEREPGMLLFGSGDLHVFRSDNLWFDPSNHIERDTVPVLVGESNLNRYWVDTSFMPKLAG